MQSFQQQLMMKSATLDIIQVGTLSSLDTDIPMDEYWEYYFSGFIYNQSDINKSGEIQVIEYYNNNTGSTTPYTSSSLRIYMGHTTLSAFPSSTVQRDFATNYAVGGTMTTVYDGSYTRSSGTGWKSITLDLPNFTYNNSDNLLVKFEYDGGTYEDLAKSAEWAYNSVSNVSGEAHSTGSIPSSGSRASFRPVTKFHVYG